MICPNEALRKVWDERHLSPGLSLFSFLLMILSLPYGIIVSVRNLLYGRGLLKSKKLPRPVISIGNLTAGGTGKTPLVMALARMLLQAGYRPAVLSRGYGRKRRAGVVIVSDGHKILIPPEEAGDEPFLMAQLLSQVPVIVGACRFRAGEWAIAALGADVLLLDDGFQHRALSRDVDIVLLDKERPVGNGRLLPGGSLREPPHALRRADVVVLTGNGGSGLESLPPARQGLLTDVPNLFQAVHKPLAVIDGHRAAQPLSFLKGRKVYAFAGIGNPQSFRSTIESLGVPLAGFAAYPDHCCYKASELAMILEKAGLLGADLILTTEKDGVRLHDFSEFLEKIFLLRVEMNLTPAAEELLKVILAKLNNES